MAGVKSDLGSKLRSRLSDERAGVAAFTLQATPNCKYAYLEIANGIMTVTVEQPSQGLQSVRFYLSDPRYDTVRKLANEFDKLIGYTVVPDTAMIGAHPSQDLRIDGVPDIHKAAYQLRHHIFSDEELNNILIEAITLHNPNYTSTSSVPNAEHPYVIMKACAHAYRILASDSAKRKGLDTDAKTFLALSRDMEEQYTRDHRRQERILPAPKADESAMGAGDAVNGMMFRRSLRAGYNASYRNSLPPVPPQLFDPSDDDVEDVQVRLRWSQNREQSFSYYEVWRDTQPVVERCIAGRLTNEYPVNSINNVVDPGPDLPISTQYSRATTSKQVLGVSAGANRISPVFDGFFFWTAAELAGSNIVNATFIDGLIFNNPGTGLDSLLGEPLEPEMTYYYRVYALNWNGEVVPSKVLKVTTKPIRAKFARMIPSNSANAQLAGNAISPLQGPIAGGTTITILGTDFPATGLMVTLGGKPCTDIVIVSSTELTCQSPAFVNTDFIGQQLDIVLLSPTSLKDIALRAWTYTS